MGVDVLARLRRDRLLLVLDNPHWTTAQLIELGDGLWAGPLLALAISTRVPALTEALPALRQRYKNDLLLGIWVAAAADVAPLLTVAHFVIAEPASSLAQSCRAVGVACLTLGDDLIPMSAATPATRQAIYGTLDPSDLPGYPNAAFFALCDTLLTTPGLPQPDLITRARQFRHAAGM